MKPSPPLRGVLLAAGLGRRFGGGKLVQRIPGSDTPLVLAAWRNLTSVLPESLAVCRPQDEAVVAMLEESGIPFVPCADAALGMGHSLACGVAASQPASGWLIALGDMPRVDPASIEAVAAALLEGAGIAIPLYQGQKGHPVGFAGRFGDALRALEGDTGARSVIHAHPEAVRLVQIDDPGILADVDTPEDLERIR